jgi:hypothetical protein
LPQRFDWRVTFGHGESAAIAANVPPTAASGVTFGGTLSHCRHVTQLCAASKIVIDMDFVWMCLPASQVNSTQWSAEKTS